MRTRKDNTPGGLAAELADAREAFAAKRDSVIERAVTRQEQIAALQAELAREQSALEGVKQDAELPL